MFSDNFSIGEIRDFLETLFDNYIECNSYWFEATKDKNYIVFQFRNQKDKYIEI